MRGSVLIVAFVMACTYADPDLSLALLRCDADHGCPPGETCLGGLCQFAGEGRNGVQCGGTVCGNDRQCCADSLNPPICGMASERCFYGALCDGPADCAPGTACCSDDTVSDSGLLPARCLPADKCLLGSQVCVTASDCPAAQPNCCSNFNDNEPWNICMTTC